jgi:hypothetical protein
VHSPVLWRSGFLKLRYACRTQSAIYNRSSIILLTRQRQNATVDRTHSEYSYVRRIIRLQQVTAGVADLLEAARYAPETWTPPPGSSGPV